MADSKAEDALRQRIQKRLTQRKVFWWSNPTTMIKGMPDSQGVHHGVPFFIEYKAVDGKLESRQRLWLQQMAQAGGLGLEVRADLEAPRPWHASYRIMYENGALGSRIPIDSDEWLDHLVHRLRQ